MTKRASCAIAQCPNASEKTAGASVTYHKFPSKDKIRRRWLRAVEAIYPTFVLDATSITPRLCSDHFQEDDLDFKNGKIVLKPDVVPSIFTPPLVPKKEKGVDKPRHYGRRAASKEALKQMQMLLEDDDDAVEIPDDEDYVYKPDVKEEEEAAPQTSSVTPSPPKKKYKLTHRKSSDGNDREVLVLKTIPPTPNITNQDVENNLDLECWVEELEPCQKERNAKLQEERQTIMSKLEELIKENNAEVIYKGDLSTAIEVSEHVQKTIQAVQASQNKPPLILNSTVATNSQPYKLMVDSRLGVLVGSVSPNSSNSSKQPKIQVATNLQAPSPSQIAGRGRPAKVKKLTPVVQSNPSTPTPVVTRSILANQVAKQVGKRVAQPPVSAGPPATRSRGNANIAPSTTRPSETNVEGGLTTGSSVKPKAIVDLTADDGKPLPDSREVSFNKLQGKTYPSLVVVARPNLRVTDVNTDRSKLDAKVKSVLMYQHAKFTEWLIQQGLIKSEQKCSVHSSNQLKLGMYSDVSKFPYSGGYVWISECCPQRFVSVFSGSIFEGSPHPPLVILKLLYHWACQTNIQNVTQWVKVDNLYVKSMYTLLRAMCTVALQTHPRPLGGPQSKVEVGVISLGTTSQDGNSRQVKVEVLGVLETSTKLIRLRAIEPDGDRNYKRRFSRILEPLEQWVHINSTIITDHTVDKATLLQMGYTNVVQTTSVDVNNSNRTIMEYLRRIVPRMFQNTLSLLSRQIIQQFLDELVWREWFGTTSLEAFDNLISHLAEQTRLSPSLVPKLNRVALNPFKNWTLSGGTVAPPSSSIVATKNFENYGKKRKKKDTEGSAKPTTPSQSENRPPKSTSPDVPEQMIPLENYYYGTIDNYPPKTNVKLNLKCPICKEVYNNNIALMGHLFKHAHNVSKDGQMCKYCLTSVATVNDLLKHIASSHPSETKHENGFVCLICETYYVNPFILGKHMSKEHCPSELPYQCGTCGYRCSNHKQAIDHFYKQHNNGPTIQCPFCLKSTTVFSSSRNIAQNMHFFIQHLQKHQRKQQARRCGRCNSWFIQKDLLKDHQANMHTSQRGKPGLVQWVAPRSGVMVPKSKMDKYPCDAEGINFSTLFYNLAKGLKCKECDGPMDSAKHFPSFESCQTTNCQFSTCCAKAMQEHNAKCNKNTPLDIPKENLPYEMFCICGFSSQDGNQLAKHLATCEKKSAYPSMSDAKNASVTHSMLDVLGLVRKPDESEKKEQTLRSGKRRSVRTATEMADEDESKPEERVAKKFKAAPKESEPEQDSSKNDDENLDDEHKLCNKSKVAEDTEGSSEKEDETLQTDNIAEEEPEGENLNNEDKENEGSDVDDPPEASNLTEKTETADEILSENYPEEVERKIEEVNVGDEVESGIGENKDNIAEAIPEENNIEVEHEGGEPVPESDMEDNEEGNLVENSEQGTDEVVMPIGEDHIKESDSETNDIEDPIGETPPLKETDMIIPDDNCSDSDTLKGTEDPVEVESTAGTVDDPENIATLDSDSKEDDAEETSTNENNENAAILGLEAETPMETD